MTIKNDATDYQFNWIDNHLHSEEEIRLFAQDSLLLRACALVEEAMRRKRMSRSELSRRIGKSKSYVSKVLSGQQNMTLATLSDLLWACGTEVASVGLQGLGDMPVSKAAMNHWLDSESAHHIAKASLDVDVGYAIQVELERSQIHVFSALAA